MPRTITIDLDSGELANSDGERYALDEPRAFEILSRLWLRSGWQTKHVYTFTWLGRPIIQLPEDMFRVQEAICGIRPDVIVEIGIAHGGSLVFYASLCKLLGSGRVVGVDIDIRSHNRRALEAHGLSDYITLIEGDAAASEVVERVHAEVGPGDKTFVMLDGGHSRDQVKAELQAYAPLVTPGSWIVAADGLMSELAGLQRYGDSRPTQDWDWNNPAQAAVEFVADNPDFAISPPDFRFNESPLREPVTYCLSGWVRRLR